MRKIAVFFLSVMLVVGIAGLTQAAKKEKPAALAEITGVSCGMVPDGNGGKFEARWSWAPIPIDGPPLQTQFGGDAIYKVDVSLDDADPITVGLEVEIVKFDELDDFDGKMSYFCEEFECWGDAYPVSNEFIIAALGNMFPEALEIVFVPIDFGEEVWVKAMNPGVESTPQNYVKVNVCPEL